MGNFEGLPILMVHCLVWCRIMTPEEHLERTIVVTANFCIYLYSVFEFGKNSFVGTVCGELKRSKNFDQGFFKV